MFRAFADLTKLGITIFVVMAGVAGYATSFAIETPFVWSHMLNLVLGLFFLSSGSLALNQAQEYKMDRLMPRTAKRPIAAGLITPKMGFLIAAICLVIGSLFLWLASPEAAILGWGTVILYNVIYTYWWKPKWIFGAIPGAIPGALPVTIGYAANSPEIFKTDSVYLFLIMFLWQMPHFWALAMRYKDDYKAGGVPTLPVALGIERTLFHMGIWTFAYVAVAVGSPWFVHASWIYLLLVIPVSFKVMQEFFRYFKSKGEQRWLAFFMWTNISMLIYLFVPVFDKWNFLFIGRN
ncbi:MAG: protoheme IX farnesyltransferase [Pseudobdellovibrionaceae bacterium]